MLQAGLNTVNCDQPYVFQLQPDHACKIANADRLLQLNRLPPGLIGKELAKYFDIDCHSAPYKVSNNVSRSESGTSNTTLCGGKGSSRMYSGIL
jgi:hypothetical protein